MAETFGSAALVGGTGLVGSQILKILLSHPAKPKTYAIGRRAFPEASPELSPIVSTDTTTWSASLKEISPSPKVLFSGLGTTRAAAGSFDAQRAIDYDLNLELACAAKESGVKVYVLISSGGVSPTSPFPYSKMKGQLEEAVKKLEFPHTVIVKPGLLIGDRKENRPSEAAFRALATGLGKISTHLTSWWTAEDVLVARSAVRAAEQCLEGKREKGIWLLNQGDLVKLGKDESK